jgi:hypothetical protein
VIGDEPGNTREDPDPSEEAVLQGEGGAGVPFLPALRQDLPRGHSGSRLCAGPCERGRAGRGRNDIRADRGGRVGRMARRPQEGPYCTDLSARTGATDDDSEARRRRATPRHPDDPGPGGADRRQAGAGAHLRGGSRPCGPWLSAGTERDRCDPGGARAALPRLHPTWWTPICRSTWRRHHNAPWFMELPRRARAVGLSH